MAKPTEAKGCSIYGASMGRRGYPLQDVRCESCVGRGYRPEKRKHSKRNPNALGFYARTCRVCGGSGAHGPKLRLYKVRLDAGGYDEGGAYWGAPSRRDGTPFLFCAYADDPTDGVHYLRAWSRAEAKAKLRADHPEVWFYR